MLLFGICGQIETYLLIKPSLKPKNTQKTIVCHNLKMWQGEEKET